MTNLDALFDDARSRFKSKRAESKAKLDFEAARNAERNYAAKMKRIIKQIRDFISQMWEYDAAVAHRINELMDRYATIIKPYATSITRRMHAEANARNLTQWKRYTSTMSQAIQKEVRETDVGFRMRQLLENQVDLITSLPRDVGERVHKLTLEGLERGLRYDDVYEMIMRTGLATESQARLIARTETARTASVLTQARAESVGSTHFIWRTMRDGTVRPSHRRLEGRTFSWDDPPECDAGSKKHPEPYRALPGQIFNCRCFPQPIIPEPD